MGRTGKWWACQHWGVCPDLMAIGKGFGGGVAAAGACVGTEQVWAKYVENPFLFTTTFGGNPLALSASIATINVLVRHSSGLYPSVGVFFCVSMHTWFVVFSVSVDKYVTLGALVLSVLSCVSHRSKRICWRRRLPVAINSWLVCVACKSNTPNSFRRSVVWAS